MYKQSIYELLTMALFLNTMYINYVGICMYKQAMYELLTMTVTAGSC